jgi:DNA-binding transcriptional LysR family regulator
MRKMDSLHSCYDNIAYMDLELLRSLLAVADTGAITEAADRIGVSQPALSRRLQQLEGHLGAALMVRSRKGIELTAIGRMVEAEARVLVSRYDNLRQQVQAHLRLEGGTIRIGGGATSVSFVLPQAIAEFQADFPGIRFHLKEAGSREVAADIASGRLELGLVTLPVQSRELNVRELMDDQIVLIGRRDHPLVAKRRVQSSDLAGLAYVGFEAGSAIRQIIDAALRAVGVEMNVVMELRSIPAILRMVATTGYLAFVSQLSIENQADIAEIRVHGLSIRRKLAIVTRQGIPLSPAGSAFAERLHSLSNIT